MPAHIALVMMVKNEEARIHVSLNSVVGTVNSMVIYDTGSSDRTTAVIEQFAKDQAIPLHLLTAREAGEFVDFSTSRNILLDYADSFPEIDYLLLLDCNDELRGGDELRRIVEKFQETCRVDPNSRKINCWAVFQHWWMGDQLVTYYNLRFMRARTGWRYNGVIHEVLEKDEAITKMPDTVILYQDRTKDDDKSARRLPNDLRLLKADHEKDPTNSRTVYYIGETLFAMSEFEDAFYYFKLRTGMVSGRKGKEHADPSISKEEVFASYMRLGKIAQIFKHPWNDIMRWYIHALEILPRAEPAVEIARYYAHARVWVLAFTFAQLACSFVFPTNAMIWVDKKMYDYTRWHLLGMTGFFVGKIEEGRHGCLIAIKEGSDVETDKKNLLFYEAQP